MKLNEMLHIKYPFIQGGMANIATGTFAAAVSNAGGLGLIGAGGMNTQMLREEIRTCKSLTDKPFGVNLMLMNPEVDQMAEMIVEEGVKIVTTGAGSPAKYMARWKENGMMVMPVVSSSLIAKKMEQCGADAVIAEGTESGGHVGEMTTMALVPQIVDSVSIPVIAAGGIADGRQLAAAFALGAVGVQLGTCLLVSKECPIHEAYKAALLKAKDNDTIVTGRIAGTPVRILKNQMAREYVKMGYYIGVGGVVTFKNAKKLVQTVAETPMERILLETDSPYLAPEPHRGHRNDSRELIYVIEKIAEIKGMTLEEVEDITWDNALRLFQL